MNKEQQEKKLAHAEQLAEALRHLIALTHRCFWRGFLGSSSDELQLEQAKKALAQWEAAQ